VIGDHAHISGGGHLHIIGASDPEAPAAVNTYGSEGKLAAAARAMSVSWTAACT